MQIRIVPQNGMHATVGRAPQIKSQSVQVSGSAFGASCKVTISKEGRRLSEQSNAQTAKSARSLKLEKKMMRQIEQSEESSRQSDALKDEYSQLVNTDEYAELLKKIKKAAKSTNNSCMSQEDMKTIERKTQLLREIGDQKQKQLEENQKNAEAAQALAVQSSKAQDEIDEKNRDLLIMLKSIEESEKAEEEAENGGKAEEDGAKADNSVGDAIQDSAAQFTASSIQRELGVTSMIDSLNADGHDYISMANEIKGKAYDEINRVRTLWNDEGYTDAEKIDATLRLGAKLIGGINSLVSDEPSADSLKELKILVSDEATEEEKEEAFSVYRRKMKEKGDLGIYRNRGVQMIKDSKEGKLLHIANNPLLGMEETKDSMMQSAIEAAFNEASQGKLDETSQELEDEVKELIDERNDITDTDTDKTEEDEEKKEIGELLQPKEDEEEQEQEQIQR